MPVIVTGPQRGNGGKRTVAAFLMSVHFWAGGMIGIWELQGVASRSCPEMGSRAAARPQRPRGRFSQLGIYKRVWEGKTHAKFKSLYAFKWKLSDSSRFKYAWDNTCARIQTHSRHLRCHLWFSQQSCEPGNVPFLPWEDSERLDHFLKSHVCLTGKAGNWIRVF